MEELICDNCKCAVDFDENLCDDYTNDNKIREIVTAGKGWG